VLKSDKEIPKQRHGAGIRIGSVSVGAEDPVTYGPDCQRYADESEEKRTTENDQLTNYSRTHSGGVVGLGERIQQGLAP
jgi:hypothetical protein